MSPIVQRIFRLMDKFNISAAALSREISLSNGLLTQWKQGKQIPSLEAICKIAKYFNVSIDYLVTGEEYSHHEFEGTVLSEYSASDDGTLASGEHLCERIKILCDMTGTTNNELEEAIGIGKNTITTWRKARSLPSCDKILGIANHFDVSTDYLLSNTDNPKSHKNRSELASEFERSLQHLAIATKEAQDYINGYLLFPKQSKDET